MALQITFDIFSGRPNPVFILDGAEATELLKRLQPVATTAAPTPAQPLGSVLSYRGLLIEQIGVSNAAFPPRFRAVDGMVVAPGTAHRTVEPAIEEFVLNAPSVARNAALVPELVALIREEAAHRRMAPPVRAPLASVVSAPPILKCPCAPLYEPAWWNDAGQKQLHNNCYNYACDYRTDTFAQPGRAGGTHMTAASCPGVHPAALSDALLDYTQLGSPQSPIRCPSEGHLVALVIWPRWDFHWYRMGRDGWWSHKPGSWPVTNIDNSNAPISDPRTANRGRYTDFCSFMIVMHGHIKIN